MIGSTLTAQDVARVLPGSPPATLVDGISLSVQPGEFVAITGPSGSGKSSLLYLMGLLDVPSSGDVLLDGVSTAKLNQEERARLRLINFGFVFQFHFLLPELSAFDNVMIPMRKLNRLSPGQQERHAYELLEALGLAAHRHKLPAQMSGGERQRTAIARALANTPPFILADEPTGALDSRNGAAVFEIFKDLASQGHTILMVTHDEHLAASTNRHIALRDGRLEGKNEFLP